jgi:aspartyl-tRNA(Asn)/glutamyl-tRNA(Gln) amidotransferase subunit A
MIREIHQKLEEGRESALGLAERYFAKIEAEDEALGAFLSLRKEAALQSAEAVDQKIKKGEPLGILEGIPGAVKDNLALAGEVTTAGSRMLETFTAPEDATAVARLRAAGAVILGKTNLDEFAMGSSTENSAFHPTKNPHDHTRVAGGSSGGSAAAVASGMAVFALGSDTGGSIRQPASFCGVVGLKPTYGRVSRNGLFAMASSLDTVGAFASSVEDAALVLSAIAGEDGKDATAAPLASEKRFEAFLTDDVRGLRIGVPKEYFSPDLDPGLRSRFERALEKWKHLGAQVTEVSLPHTAHALAAYYIIMPAEVSSNLARLDGIRYGLVPDPDVRLLERYLSSRSEGFGAEVKRRIMLGTHALSSGYYDAYYGRATEARALIRGDFERVFEKVDVLFSLTTPETAFPLGAKTKDPLTMYLSDIFTVPANLAGIPALSLPLDREAGLPVGGQLMAKWFDEERLLAAGHAFERLGREEL